MLIAISKLLRAKFCNLFPPPHHCQNRYKPVHLNGLLRKAVDAAKGYGLENFGS